MKLHAARSRVCDKLVEKSGGAGIASLPIILEFVAQSVAAGFDDPGTYEEVLAAKGGIAHTFRITGKIVPLASQ